MALVEEISAVVLDGGEPLSFRSLSATVQVSAAESCAALEQFARDHSDQVGVLHVTVERASSGTSSDPRSRVIRLGAAPPSKDAVLSDQVYALYLKEPGADDSERAAIACWARERHTRREIFAQVAKHAPLSLELKALYASGISCAEATPRAELSDDRGEETVSAFDAISISKKSKASTEFFSKSSAAPAASSSSSSSKPTATSSSSSSSSFFKSSATNSSRSKKSSTAAVRTEPEVKKVSAESMSNVLSIDSSDEDGSDKEEETDAPVFVRKANAKASRSSRVISDDDEEMEEAEDTDESRPTPSKRGDSGRSTKRKAQEESSSQQSSESEELSPSKKARASTEDPDAPVTVAPTRRVLVTKTRITPEGYMVTEKTYEEQTLTPEEMESERQAALKRQRLAAKAKSGGDKSGASGLRKQKDLRSFFMKK